MQPIIPSMTVNAKTVAAILGVSFETFSTWRKRSKLLDRCQSGRGYPAAFTYADVLAAHVAKKLMDIGLAAEPACKAANQAHTLTAFTTGKRVEFYLGKDKILQGADPHVDVLIGVPLETIGWEVAEAFADVLPEDERSKALDEFRALVEQERTC